MKNLFKKLFSTSKEEPVLFYVDGQPFFAEELKVNTDGKGRKYINAFAYFSLQNKKWVFYRRKNPVYITLEGKLREVRYFDEHNIMKRLVEVR